MQAKISKRTVDQLVAGQSIADTEVRGFRARCLPSGVVAYEFRYRKPDGMRKFVKLGLHGSITPDTARDLAKKRAGEVADRRDPAAEREAERAAVTNTVNAILDGYIKHVVKGRGLRSEATINSAFDRLVRPTIGAKSIYGLKRSDVVKMLDKIADDSGPVMADRTLAYLRSAFNWQAARDDDFNPPIAKGMARTKPGERKRERVLDDTEIRDLWTALEQLQPGKDVPPCYARYIRALLLSGQRRVTVSRAHSDEIDRTEWIIPAVRMKRGRDHRNKDHLAPITGALAAQFGNGNGFLFSSDGGKSAFSGFAKAKRALDKKIAEMRKRDHRKPMPHWTLHDLRRTARTIMSRYTTPDVAERVIGHVIGGVRGVYDLHEYAEEKRAALDKLAIHIAGIVAEQSDVIVKFPEGKGSRSGATVEAARIVGS